MALKATRGPGFGSLDEPLLDWVDAVFAGENLLQAILHGHLLVERALQAKIAEKMARPDVLNSNLARFSFAQKVAIYVGLYDPEPHTERLLVAFNRLRNALAHDLVEPEAAVKQYLSPALEDEGQVPEDPRSVVQVVFGGLMLFGLGALHGVERTGDA
jgi:hypothetical protein